MQQHPARRKIKMFSMAIMISLLLPSFAQAWEAATHAYIEEHLFKGQGLSDENLMNNRIYGANTIDVFNNNFSQPYLSFQFYLHDPAQENFMKVWDLADTATQKAFAYGFVGHNNSWGMDYTAHISGITLGRDQGYVIAKAGQLAALLGPMLESPEINLSLPENVLLDICHYLVESGVDLLVRDLAPGIGDRLMTAAYFRSDEIPALLTEAYAAEFADLAGGEAMAAQMILTSESAFRTNMMAYGWALSQDNALELIAGGLARQATDYFAMLGLPPVAEEILTEVAKQGISAAMAICDKDFQVELRATTGWVNGNLSSAGVAW
ncbi:MAG: hypothetical protein OEY01_05495 [Desulfobulbaceae bacterium]|nr:hypothetical protein [Desulfobulbaceae bacterium]HIJ78563.1 hypothetical protein [Deltaproteobacteria bacterium]